MYPTDAVQEEIFDNTIKVTICGVCVCVACVDVNSVCWKSERDNRLSNMLCMNVSRLASNDCV